MFHNIGALHHSTLIESGEVATSRPRTPWYRTRCWKVFMVSLTCTGVLLCFTSAFYLYLVDRTEYKYCVIPGIVCLMVFMSFVSEESPYRNTARPLSAVPVQIASGARFREVLGRTDIERGTSLVPERDDLFYSLTGYVLIPADQKDRDEASNASTESTLSAESTKRHEVESELLDTPEKQEILKQPATGGQCAAAKLSEAATGISEIVKDILKKAGNASCTVVTTTAEQSSDDSSEKGKEANKEGVRQRKPTPMETQEYISLTENLK